MSKKDTIQPYIRRGLKLSPSLARTQTERTQMERADFGESDDSLDRWIDDARERLAVENWREIGATGNPAFQNSWVNRTGEAAAAFYKDPFDRVWLKGGIDSGTTNQAAFTLPLGYRPSEKQHFPAHQIGSVVTDMMIIVNTDGTVVPTNGTSFGATLAGMSFRV